MDATLCTSFSPRLNGRSPLLCMHSVAALRTVEQEDRPGGGGTLELLRFECHGGPCRAYIAACVLAACAAKQLH